MLIRSQDREVLLVMDGSMYLEAESIGDGRTVIWAVCGGDEATVIGTYSTQDKALTALDEIAYHYEHNKDAECFGTHGSHFCSYVFQMPADDDGLFKTQTRSEKGSDVWDS